MTADNNSTEDKPDPTPFQSLPNDERSAQQAHAGRAHQGICLQGAGYQICRSPSRRVLRGLSARQENLALVSDRLLMSCVQKPTTALTRRGSTAKPPTPDPLAPISGKDNHDHRTMAKVGRDEWL